MVAALHEVAERMPALILTSFELEGLRGNSLVAALKCDPVYRAIPICVMTSVRSPEAFFLQYQPDALLGKNSSLEGGFGSFLDSIEVAVPFDGSAVELTTLDATVLLVEDAQFSQILFSRRLHVAGATVIVAENGAEALYAMDERHFDLILMDIEMPEMDGREATVSLRSRGVTTPILALTAHGESFRQEALELGFNDVLSKSVSQDELLAACRRYLTTART